jgi:hypothetical protein
MARRIDYHDDPAAPKPNSLVPAAGAREETGVAVEITGLPGIYSDPGHLVCPTARRARSTR